MKTYLWYLPRPESKYHGSYPLFFIKRFKRLVGARDDFVHLFAGRSKFGFRVDMKIENRPDMVADVHYLPFRDQTFNNSLADPPYSDDFAKELYNTPPLKSSQWVKEMVRITREGGLVCIMHNYPMGRPKQCKYEFLIVIVQRIKQYCKVVTGFRKEGTLIPYFKTFETGLENEKD